MAPVGAAVEAAVRCEPEGGAAARLTLVTYSDADELRDAWSAQLEAIQPSLEEAEDACEGGTIGVGRWGFGRLACGIEDGSAMVAWTDSRSGLLGIARGSGPEVSELYAWWQDDAKPLGRIANEGPSTSEPETDGRTGRVPGAPGDAVCTSLDEPIVDTHGRTWQVERVRFVGEPDLERVVFVLQRTGRVRPGRGAVVTVDRMPIADVISEVPGASRPERGRTALVIRMQGVNRAPALRAHRPEGVDLIRELSIVRGDGSRTAILSVNGDACYQVRIPVFGPSASGNEDRAEVIIDIPR
jgi:hypothetical protein